jgi:hypothetical protein
VRLAELLADVADHALDVLADLLAALRRERVGGVRRGRLTSAPALAAREPSQVGKPALLVRGGAQIVWLGALAAHGAAPRCRWSSRSYAAVEAALKGWRAGQRPGTSQAVPVRSAGLLRWLSSPELPRAAPRAGSESHAFGPALGSQTTRHASPLTQAE